MIVDYKDRIQDHAEELAEELYGKDYFALTDEQRQICYERAYQEYRDCF